ncbi:MAG TPA: POTRA domain-containing protein [Pyrinomonadaceae bacterium]|nr:POTRA domain-containing protein [Pyrinomonadaceae bacterium]
MAKAIGGTAKYQWETRKRAILFVAAICAVLTYSVSAQNKYEGHRIGNIKLTGGASQADVQSAEEYRLIIRGAVGEVYSTPRIRDAIEALYNTKRIDTIQTSAALTPAGDVDLTFEIRRKIQAQKVNIEVGPTTGEPIKEDDLLLKLNIVSPGAVVTEQSLRSSADEILDYLRDHGYYRSEVTYEKRPLEFGNDIGVTFRVSPNEPTSISDVTASIDGFTKPIDLAALRLKKGGLYSHDRLTADVTKIRDLLRKEKFIAPELDEPKVTYDSDANTISVAFTGKVGPTVEVVTETGDKVSKESRKELIPVLRDGTLDFAAIVEGERRLETAYQEQGYFFANVTPVCSVKPTLADTENNPIANGTEFLCSFLGGEDLSGHEVEIKYHVDLNRRLTLTEIRLRGTDKLPIEEVKTVLGSQEANALGIIPFLAYGRGYTSERILDEDTQTIKSLMAGLGYREAQVHAVQGVSPNGDNLIITFQVEEGPPTVVTETAISGNTAIPTQELMAQIPVKIAGRNFSQARNRNAAQTLTKYYAEHGYYDARVVASTVEAATPKPDEERHVKIVFRVDHEGKKVVIDRVLVTGNEHTKTAAIQKAVVLEPGELLKSSDVYSSEQNLYGSDAFSRVDIKPQPAGDGPDGTRKTDIIVSVEEQPTRLMSYGGGYSTDLGASGFFDIRHVNLFRNLWQGGARLRYSQRQQLVQFDFVDPRFMPDGKKRFSALTLSLQFQRDSTVTRFFRSAFDKGTFGIVQRIDASGNPIDQFGQKAGSPTLNRLAFSAETSRTISRKSRSLLFVRARFEDVRLANIDSLLIKELLLPDSRTRISGFSTTFVRDTRKNCAIKYSVLETIAKGDPVEPCRYNASDPTGGQYVTADYSVSLPVLGANVGFHKVQASYNLYYSPSHTRRTTFAARAIIGAGSVFSGGNRYTGSQFAELNGLLPISERFFGGGANNLRGFEFEEAGPRVAIVPSGTFRDSKGNLVGLDPFTIPFGGNAIAVVNLEGRLPLTSSIRIVPFYDGGNVFRNAKDIFRAPSPPAGNIALQNQAARWTNTVGLGFRIKTPVGGEFGFDYGRLLNPSIFLIPQGVNPPALYKLPQDHIHFRFSQAF